MKTTIILCIVMVASIATAGDIVLCLSDILTPSQTNRVEMGLNTGEMYREPTGSQNRIETWAQWQRDGHVWRVCVYRDDWVLRFQSYAPTRAQINQWIADIGIGQSPKRIDVLTVTNGTVRAALEAAGYVEKQ